MPSPATTRKWSAPWRTSADSCDAGPFAAYAPIDGVVVALLPVARFTSVQTGRVVPRTLIETLPNADILAEKLVERMYGGEVFEPRDIFDLTTAAHKDPAALEQALNCLNAQQRTKLADTMTALPKNWVRQSTRPLINPTPPCDAATLAARAIALLAPASESPGFRP